MSGKYELAAYYFPQWHPDSLNEDIYGKGWTEWERLKAAKPKFEGHLQPKIPLWGMLDESRPEVAEKQIEAAAGSGITTFIYDWYWDFYKHGRSKTGPFLNRALDEGFLKAKNKDRLKFALMWANHHEMALDRFESMVDFIIGSYFSMPNYWRIDGKLYFSFYEIHTLVNGFGGLDETAKALEGMRNKAKKAGLPELHLNAIDYGVSIASEDHNTMLHKLGFDSVTSYAWIHKIDPEGFPQSSYPEWVQKAKEQWPVYKEMYELPYYPNVTVGWDPSPRTDQDGEFAKGPYPYTPILVNNTPEEFKKALINAKEFMDKYMGQSKILTIYAWNEWTEGGFLEPDTTYGLGYLEAIREIFYK